MYLYSALYPESSNHIWVAILALIFVIASMDPQKVCKNFHKRSTC